MKKINKILAGFTAFLLLVTALPVSVKAETPEAENLILEETRHSFDSQALPITQEPRITFELKGVEVLDVLKIISQRSDLNIVAGKNVRGPVTLYLKDVPIRHALTTIMSSLDLAYVEENGIINVMTAKEYEDIYGRSFGKAYETKAIKVQYAAPAAVNLVVEKLKSPKGKSMMDERTNTLIITDRADNISVIETAVRELDQPLITKVYQLTYATVEDLDAQLRDYLTPETGVAKVDKRTNQITITDRIEKIEKIDEVVKALDRRPRQVLIQAQLIEVDLFDAFRYGIDWEFVRTNVGKFSTIDLQPAFDIAAPTAALGAGTLSTFTFGGIQGLSAVLSLLQNVGKTNTLSSPRITVINNEEAKLVDATRQPYVSQTVVQAQTSSQTADNIQFVDVGVTLTVVPTIVDDEKIILKLKPEVSSQTGTLNVQSVSEGSDTAFTRSSIPIVTSQTLETTVIVKSGETLVVGGLIKDNETKIRRKLPILSDIPFIGAAFRSETVDFNKTELVVFLTPYVVTGDETSKEHSKYFDADDQLVDFDLVGGGDFGKALKHSQGPFRLDHEPFWKIDDANLPQYLHPKDLYERANPYEGNLNQYEKYEEGKPLHEADALRKQYQAQVFKQVQGRVKSMTKNVEGQADIALRIAKNGTLKEASWIDPGPLTDRDQQRQILRSIQETLVFPSFPEGLKSDEELIALRLQI